jgi:hypothetical protein
MSEIWDKLKTEIDKAGKAAQEALDEGKIRYDLFRLRQSANKSAQDLGYAFYRARKDGREMDHESYSRLFSALAEQETEMARLDALLKTLDAPEASSPDASGSSSHAGPPPPAT